ncbi:ribonuclease H [Dokdonia sinensis]|uniref:Ribonuclease H n=1 Tax=Dokdonia sinensis TaxID=2479847 RepID=A0A3M0GED7_9FLAO|nr:ribonuclease H family protein [Dokdonia sinensis]RMB63265.1 ribonuclease H [Dokdonia sinensis]
MSKKKEKFYVVWEGKKPGIYLSWKDCKAMIDGYAGAKYKSFETFAKAKTAYNGDYNDFKGTSKKKRVLTADEKAKYGEPNLYSIAVDAASSGNPGIMEYRGVDTQTVKQLFHQGPFKQGTNNIGEFLALVHGLAYLKKIGSDRIIYSDSRIAIGWVKKKKCNTKLQENTRNKDVIDLVRRAEQWLKSNTYTTTIVKWETKAWGEIPADFGRK